MTNPEKQRDAMKNEAPSSFRPWLFIGSLLLIPAISGYFFFNLLNTNGTDTQYAYLPLVIGGASSFYLLILAYAKQTIGKRIAIALLYIPVWLVSAFVFFFGGCLLSFN